MPARYLPGLLWQLVQAEALLEQLRQELTQVWHIRLPLSTVPKLHKHCPVLAENVLFDVDMHERHPIAVLSVQV